MTLILVLLPFVKTVIIYGFCLWAIIFTFRRLHKNRRDRVALFVGGIAALVPLSLIGHVALGAGYKLVRSAEVASWLRIDPPNPLPKALIIAAQMDGGDYPNYILEIAESGLFDVYQWDKLRNKIWHIEVAERSDCIDRRIRDDRRLPFLRFVALTGFARCAAPTLATALPAEALILYEGDSIAPLAPHVVLRGADSTALPQPADWALQLSVRSAGEERLIAYTESVRGLSFAFSLSKGLHVARSPERKQRLTAGSYTGYVPRADLFFFDALDIDYTDIQPAGTLAPDKIKFVVDRLVERADEKSTQALGRLAEAYPSVNPIIADGLERVAANPQTFMSYWVSPIECGYIEALSQYQTALDRGCSANPSLGNFSNCGNTTNSESWQEICAQGEGIDQARATP